MHLIEKLKGVIRKMIGPKTLENVLQITPTISTTMKNAIELWEDMYMDKSPWINENIKSLGIPALIASEKARTATIEMNVKITGESERAKFIKSQFIKIIDSIRSELEVGIALGGIVIKPYVTLGPDGKYVIEFNYTRASDFYPLSFSPEGKITEAAFIDKIISKDTVYSKLEYHKLEGTVLTVSNLAFKSNKKQPVYLAGGIVNELGEPIPLSSVSAWANIEPLVTIDGVDTMLFSYFKMPEANTVDLDSPLGASGFSRAVDLIREADEQYSNLLWEFEGGQLAVDVDRTALNPVIGKDGTKYSVLPKLQDRLYRRNLDLGDDNAYNVFSPALRDTSIINGLNNILMHIEDVCNLARGTLSTVSYTDARTATELRILKQRSYAANSDVQKELQNTFECLISIMDKYCDLYEITPSGDYEVAYAWDDSIIVDKDAERQQDMLEVKEGLMSKVEYRMKWYGETEVQALEALNTISNEKQESIALAQSASIQNINNNKANTSVQSDAEATQNKLVRANETNEVTETSSASK